MSIGFKSQPNGLFHRVPAFCHFIERVVDQRPRSVVTGVWYGLPIFHKKYARRIWVKMALLSV